MAQGKTDLINIPLDPRNTKKTVIRHYIIFYMLTNLRMQVYIAK